MRKLMISLAAAGTALAFATPASAQIFGNIGVGVGTPGYGYGQPSYGYGNGYGGYGYNNYGQVRALQARIDAVQYQIRQLDRRDVIRDRSADRLREESRGIEYRLHAAARNGLNPYEASEIQNRISRLEQRVHYAVAQRYGRGGYGGYNNGYGYQNGYGGGYDRDRDGRDDRYENDHGWHHDGDRDDD